MLKFDIVDGKAAIKAEQLTIKEFADLYAWDKDPKKKRANQFFVYLFHAYSLSNTNPNFDVSEEERDRMARYNAFADSGYKFTPEEMRILKPAIKAYEFYNTGAARRAYRIQSDTVDKLMQYLENQSINSKNFDEVFSNTIKVDKLLDSLNKSEAVANKRATQAKNHANSEESPLEKGLIGYKPREQED